jgi:hypothetical protein
MHSRGQKLFSTFLKVYQVNNGLVQRLLIPCLVGEGSEEVVG